MNLKEAFRYQNKLQSTIDEAQLYLSDEANVTKVQKTYLRHKVNPEAEDETVVVATDNEYRDRVTEPVSIISRIGPVSQLETYLAPFFRIIDIDGSLRDQDFHRSDPVSRMETYSTLFCRIIEIEGALPNHNSNGSDPVSRMETYSNTFSRIIETGPKRRR